MSFYVRKQPKQVDFPLLKATPEVPYNPLPLTLQELCLLEVINDVDSYPVELLASLPRWLRCRLLSNLPILDLCHLESTPVAKGVDINKIWKTRYTEEPTGVRRRSITTYGLTDSRREFFKRNFEISVQGSQGAKSNYYLREENLITKAFENLKKAEQCQLKMTTRSDAKEMFVLEVVSSALSYSSKELDLKTIAHKLVSVRGDLLLHDLDAKPRQLVGGQTIWSVQGNSLVVSTTCKHKPERTAGVLADMKNEQIQLTPHRFLPICDTTDQLQLLFLLVKSIGNFIKPSSVNLDIGPGGMLLEIRDNLLLKQIMTDNGLNPPPDSIDITPILKFLLENVVILRLQNQNYAYTGVLISLLEIATLSGNDSKLKSLFCTLPGIYSETVQPFTALFSLRNFQLLHLDLKEATNPQVLIKLLQGFMAAPCSHSQRLVITRGFAQPFLLNESQVASLDMGGATVPDCALQHKTLEATSPESILQFILLLPSVRLTELSLNSHYSYVHLCSCHPDLQAAKLILDLNFSPLYVDRNVYLATIKDDLISLISKPNLQEISITGKWKGFQEAKLGLLLGLGKHPHHLKKIVLNVKGYEDEELKALWTALFMFKQSHELDIILGAKFRAEIGTFQRGDIYKSWEQLTRDKPAIHTKRLNVLS